jgi:pyrroloquinoline quinone biosynthesis protein B
VTLVDATPDIRSQIAELRESAGTEAAPGIPADRILLTHAHTGHYTGLIHLGRESMAARGAPVLATSRMRAFLESNKPWSRLVEWGHIALRTLEPGGRVDLASPRSGPPGSVAPGISVEAISVPHRGEDSDTVGFIFRGPRRRLLYVPDTNAWATWPRPLESYLAEVDVALLDGTFFDGSELPGRDLREIPHPFITATMEILGKRAGSGRCRVLFTHLNHTNPALDADSGEAARVRDSGFEIAREGMEFAL